VASSTAEAIVAGDGETPERLDATASRNPLVRGTADYLNERFGSLSAIERSQQLEFTLDGERQFVQVLPFNDNRGLDWLIVLVVPETDFMAQIHANTRTTIALCLLALGVATAVGIAFSRWITQPILHLNQASQAIAAGDLKQHVRVKGIRELETLAASFNSMADRLKWSFQTLETKNADLQQAKDDLAQAKEHLEAVLNAVPGSISWIGAGGIYLGVNRYLADSLSLPPEDIIGKEIGFFNNSPEYAQFLHQFLASSEEAASQIISVTVKGELRYYLIAVQKYQQNSAAVSVGIDVTERRQAQEALRIAEENYRSIYENALEGIFQSTPDGRYMSVNPAMARIHGFNSPEEMVASITNIGKQIYADWQRREEFKRLMGEYGEVKGFEYAAYHSNGTLIWLEENTRAVLDGCGHLLYYEGIIQEITDRKRQEADLKRQLEELKIEIDHKKRAQEVAKITQSDYFQELQDEVSEVNLDEFWS
jgi:PAS domain S-box-containing protein